MGTHSRCSDSSVFHANLAFLKCLYYVSGPEPDVDSHLIFTLSCEKGIIIPVLERKKVKTSDI